MAEADLKKAVLIPVPLPVDITDDCARLLGQICFANSAIDPRAIRALAFLTDKVDVSGSTVIATIVGTPDVNVTDRCARLLGTLCSGGVAIDPRDRNWDLNFATDQVDASGSTVTATISGTPDVNVTDRESREVGLTTMKDAFMELRLMADYLKDIPLTIDPSTSRVRTKIEESVTLNATVATVTTVSTVTNVVNFGGRDATLFQDDIITLIWNTGIRPQII